MIVLALWGGGTVAVYGRVLWARRVSNLIHHDRRSRRDYLEAFGLFMVALSSALSIGLVLFAGDLSGPRSLITAMSLGAFLAVGIFMATEKTER